jgi:hypothetical protein
MQQPAKKRRTAADLLRQAKRLSHQQQGLPYEAPKRPTSGPLVPVYIGLDSQSGEFREQLLWRIDEKEITTAAAAARLCHELCLPAAQFEKFIEQQIDVGIKHYKNWRPLDGERLVRLRIAVRRGGQLFRDHPVWDLANPHNTATLYASVTCHELGLDHAWYEAIQFKLQQLLDDVRYELHNFPQEVQLLNAPQLGLEQAAAAKQAGQEQPATQEQRVKEEQEGKEERGEGPLQEQQEEGAPPRQPGA